jgi:hypothetical protein
LFLCKMKREMQALTTAAGKAKGKIFHPPTAI